MNTILFLHDTSLNTPRGAELTIKQLISVGKNLNYHILVDNLKDFDNTKKNILESHLLVLNSTSRCSFELELIDFIITQSIPYIKIEFDYNFCIRRNILCTVDSAIKNCCNADKFHIYRNLFAKAELNIFQSPKHYQAHFDFYGEAVKNHKTYPPTVDIDLLKIDKNKIDNVIPFFGDLNYLKGGKAYVAFAEGRPKIQFPVYGENKLNQTIPNNISFHKPISNAEVLKILGKTKTLFCQPIWPEPSGRLVAEAFLSGCEIIGNDRIGTFSFDFYPDNKPKAINEMKTVIVDFWTEIETILKQKSKKKNTKLKKVLVYKSYGGLGDIFFAIPAINKLAKVSESVDFAVAPRLVSFFSQHLKKVNIVNEEDAKLTESNYSHIYELGNYPAFRGYDLPHALTYPTHKKVKQHAIQHYIDTISNLHISIDSTFTKYPYFKKTNLKLKKHYVIHHGAGFLLKIWPTEKYAQLIEKLTIIYPTLDCKVIMGPNDPDIASHFTKPMPHVRYITGDMNDVGEALSGALFHIGNDAGITHVAGAYNVPTVGIYGPTGPGSWGSFSENNELIWGKKGVCNIQCNYDVILKCEHKICLNSVTVNRVIEALFKVLQKAYPKEVSLLKINPQAEIDYEINNCMIKLYENEFLLEYNNNEMKHQVETLLNTASILNPLDDDLKLVLDVLKQQHIVFNIPAFI